jgi:hypothetical protein
VLDVGAGVDDERASLERLAHLFVEADHRAAITGVGRVRDPLLLPRPADVGGRGIDEHLHPIGAPIEAAVPRKDERVAPGLLDLRPARGGGAAPYVTERERLRSCKRRPLQHSGFNADRARSYSENPIPKDKRVAVAAATLVL